MDWAIFRLPRRDGGRLREPISGTCMQRMEIKTGKLNHRILECEEWILKHGGCDPNPAERHQRRFEDCNALLLKESKGSRIQKKKTVLTDEKFRRRLDKIIEG